MQLKKVTAFIQIAIGAGLLVFGIFLWVLHPIIIGLLLVGCWMIVRGVNDFLSRGK